LNLPYAVCWATERRFHGRRSSEVSVRQAEDLEGGALTYAEIKAIASGNPAVMEKVKVDTEVRRLDQLRSAHMNQQYSIRMKLHGLPHTIERTKESLGKVERDIATRDAHPIKDDFTMTVGKKVFSGEGARAEAAKALNHVILSWRTDTTLQPRAVFRGFEILSKGHGMTKLGAEEVLPDVYVRGAGTYSAKLNEENPLGTMQSIEHVLRKFEDFRDQDMNQIERDEKALADYRVQADKPFEHEAKLKELVARQAQLNAALDLDKSDKQAAQVEDAEVEARSPSFVERVQQESEVLQR